MTIVDSEILDDIGVCHITRKGHVLQTKDFGRPAEPILWQKSDDILWKMSHRNGKRRIYFKDDLFLLKKFVIFQFANFHTSLPKIPTIIHCSSIVVGCPPSNSHD